MILRDLSKYNYIKQEDYEVVAGPDWPSFDEFRQHQDIADFVYAEIDTMLSDVKPFKHPSFCVLPFYGWEYPQKTTCCLIERGSNLDSLRTEMLSGLRPTACNKCWKLEDAGMQSDRQIKNATLDFYFKQNLETLFQRAQSGDYSPVSYKFETNNTCNATCITCGSHFSSAWAQLEKKNGKTPSKHWQISNQEIDAEINYATAQSVGFRGGEPLLSDTNFYILEQLIKHNNQDCFINFVTNGSIELSDRQKKILVNFPNMNFCFSIDGVGPVFEYLRYPTKWDQIERNIDYCRKNNILISASYTVSNLNILYHNQTVAWFKDNNIPYLFNPVYYPNYYKISALPKTIKDYIVQQGIDAELLPFIQPHSDHDDQDYQQFLVEIARQDQWKGISMQEYLPEYAALIDHK
jgi:sulfatase maturation enzyme AslB (radical SAM superfamily)